MTGPDHRRLADYVINRRTELDYASQEELAEAAGVSLKTVGRLENGASVASATLGKVERALKWKPGSMRAVLIGREPTPIQMDEAPLTDEQKLLRRAYDSWERDHGPKEALRRLRDEVNAINAERDEKRPAG
jgi:transcriptional regulator with XRE-family HTH domain